MTEPALKPEATGPRSLRDRFVSGTTYSLTAVIAAQALALITSVIYARLLGRADLGVLVIYVQTGNVATALASLSLGTATARFVARLRVVDKQAVGSFVSTVLAITLAAGTAVGAGLFVVADYLGRTVYGSQDLVLMLRLSAVFLPASAIAGLGSSILQGMHAIRKLSFLGIFLEALGIPVTYFSLVSFGLIGAAIGGVLTGVASLVLIFGTALRALGREGIRASIAFHRDQARDLFRYSIPLLVSATVIRLALLYQSSFLALTLGFGEAGLFKVATTLYRVILFVPAAMSVPLLPLTSELYATATSARAERGLTLIMRLTSYAGIVLALGIGLGARPLIGVLYGPEFGDAAPLVFVLAINGFVEMIDTVSVNSALAEGRTNMLLKLDVLHSVLIVLTTTVFVTSFGFLGVGYAMLLTSLAHATLLMVALSLGNRLSPRRVAPAQLFAAVSFVLGAIAVALGNAQSNLWLAGGVLTVVVLSSWISLDQDERRVITSVIQNAIRRLRS